MRSADTFTQGLLTVRKRDDCVAGNYRLRALLLQVLHRICAGWPLTAPAAVASSFNEARKPAEYKSVLSEAHFSAGCFLIQAWAR